MILDLSLGSNDDFDEEEVEVWLIDSLDYPESLFGLGRAQ
jgi:hypothetical protein